MSQSIPSCCIVHHFYDHRITGIIFVGIGTQMLDLKFVWKRQISLTNLIVIATRTMNNVSSLIWIFLLALYAVKIAIERSWLGKAETVSQCWETWSANLGKLAVRLPSSNRHVVQWHCSFLLSLQTGCTFCNRGHKFLLQRPNRKKRSDGIWVKIGIHVGSSGRFNTLAGIRKKLYSLANQIESCFM
jgi:hypothetical protein